ncbi:MAG: GNAT family N-acetyltransferase [Bacteroidetes bacterium]|nr:GNAT family N-acetyltransferase [Bacteroidota bacterium]MBU1114028.1 GNAT family N-acetyltransferase [Bacteroidota bacterium]MBU1798956.1 GNAT family N-acetyltransferase [Bacteroidota bacterium]
MDSYYQIIGYVGSLLVALSLSMKNIRLLRRINIVGAFTFSMYGLLIGAMPVFILNGYIVLIDIYYLYKMYTTEEQFKMVPVLDKKHNYLKLFLEYYLNDILQFFPNFNRDKLDSLECFFLLRDLRPVGLLIFEEISNKEIKIHIDYVIPEYRDLKSGKYLYNSEIKYLKNLGYELISTESNVKAHVKYLINVGFQKSSENNLLYTKVIL